MALRDPREEEGLRSLLGVVSSGFLVVGLFMAVMSYFDEGTTRSMVLDIMGISFLGLLGLIGAAVGRSLSRWLLAGFGVVLIGAATYVWIHSFSSGPTRFVVVLVAGMVLFGVSAVVVSWRSIRRNRLNRRSPQPGRPASPAGRS